jgi:hypothetical protein
MEQCQYNPKWNLKLKQRIEGTIVLMLTNDNDHKQCHLRKRVRISTEKQGDSEKIREGIIREKESERKVIPLTCPSTNVVLQFNVLSCHVCCDESPLSSDRPPRVLVAQPNCPYV